MPPFSHSFPVGLDTYPQPSGMLPLSSNNGLKHSEYNRMYSEALQPLQAKVGINNSAVLTSLDYLIALIRARANSFNPTGSLGSTIERRNITTASYAAIASGALRLDGIFLEKGQTVSNIAYWTGSTAAGAPTNWWYALYTYHASAPVLLGQTADQLTLAMAANTKHLLALADPYVVPASGDYYTGIMVAAGSVPTLRGASSSLQYFNEQVPVLGRQTGDTGLTTTAPATASAISSKEEFVPYVQVS